MQIYWWKFLLSALSTSSFMWLMGIFIQILNTLFRNTTYLFARCLPIVHPGQGVMIDVRYENNRTWRTYPLILSGSLWFRDECWSISRLAVDAPVIIQIQSK